MKNKNMPIVGTDPLTDLWDAENRLIQMTAHASLPAGARKELKFAYDDQGRRIYRRISAWTGSSYTPTQTNYYYWSGWTCIGEYFPGGGRSYLGAAI